MKYFCKGCGTEAAMREICSGCGSMLTLVSAGHQFALEIIDQVVSAKAKEPVVYERRGPFTSATEADQWWEQHQAHDRYTGCTAQAVLLEPPVHFSDEYSN